MLTLVAMFASGCGTKAIYATDYCLVAEPIMGSAEDTTETLEQIERHNLTWYRICVDKE